MDGVYKLTAEDLTDNVMFPDAIAMGGYPIDVHSPDGGNTVHKFLKPGSWYSVPYRSLVTPGVENLIVALPERYTRSVLSGARHSGAHGDRPGGGYRCCTECAHGHACK